MRASIDKQLASGQLSAVDASALRTLSQAAGSAIRALAHPNDPGYGFAAEFVGSLVNDGVQGLKERGEVGAGSGITLGSSAAGMQLSQGAVDQWAQEVQDGIASQTLKEKFLDSRPMASAGDWANLGLNAPVTTTDADPPSPMFGDNAAIHRQVTNDPMAKLRREELDVVMGEGIKPTNAKHRESLIAEFRADAVLGQQLRERYASDVAEVPWLLRKNSMLSQARDGLSDYFVDVGRQSPMLGGLGQAGTHILLGDTNLDAALVLLPVLSKGARATSALEPFAIRTDGGAALQAGERTAVRFGDDSVIARLRGEVGISPSPLNTPDALYRLGTSAKPLERTYEHALSPQLYTEDVARHYGINLRGSGQGITLLYDETLEVGKLGVTYASEGGRVIRIGPDALIDQATTANTIAHELSHARDYLRGRHKPHGDASSVGDRTPYGSGNALQEWIEGTR
jgi:hypothetical protein